MELISKADLHKRTNRELAGMQDQIRRELGACEQKRRKGHAALAAVRTVQGQRRVMRPNL